MIERLREGKVKKKEQSVIYTTAMEITVFCFFCFILFIILISFNFNSFKKTFLVSYAFHHLFIKMDYLVVTTCYFLRI